MYNVLDVEGNKIQVKEINPQIHRHLSGREFTEDDACVKKQIKKEEIISKFDKEEAIKRYTEKYGTKPSHLMKLETIISKL